MKLRELLAQAAAYIETAALIIAEDLDGDEDDTADALGLARQCFAASKGELS